MHLHQQMHTEHQALGLTLILALIWFGLGALAAALLPVLELIAAAAARTTAPTPASNPTEGPSPLAAAWNMRLAKLLAYGQHMCMHRTEPP